MLSHFFEIVLYFLKNRSIMDIFTRVTIFLMFFTWIAFAYILATNFDMLVSLVGNKNSGTDYLVERETISIQRIQTILNDIMDGPVQVDRVYYDAFHNNTSDLVGIHFLYSSRRVEISRRGISQNITRNQSIPTAIFPKMLEKFATGDCWVVTPEDVGAFSFFQTQGVNAVMRCPVYNVNDNSIIGFVGVELVFDSFSDNDVAILEKLINRKIVRIEELVTDIISKQ